MDRGQRKREIELITEMGGMTIGLQGKDDMRRRVGGWALERDERRRGKQRKYKIIEELIQKDSREKRK